MGSSACECGIQGAPAAENNKEMKHDDPVGEEIHEEEANMYREHVVTQVRLICLVYNYPSLLVPPYPPGHGQLQASGLGRDSPTTVQHCQSQKAPMT